MRGRRVIRLGGNAIASHSGGNSKEFGGPIYLGQFIYNTCTQALIVCESAAYLDNIANVRSYTQSYGNPAYTVNDVLAAGFVQDDFRARPDLTFNLGLRYSNKHSPTFITDSRRALAFLITWPETIKPWFAADSAFTIRKFLPIQKPITL